ncbi:MAG: hypothetical protein ILP19_08695 [Oscillospiraceae bacterium]|nr:hypothetical protein [Oscillospiraceae bacterium]
MLKINDDLLKQCLDGFNTEYECPVFGTLSVIDSFLSSGRDYLPAFAAVSKYRTLLLVPISLSVYTDGTVDLLEYPLLRCQRCDVTRTLFGNYHLKFIYKEDKKSEILKLNVSRSIPGAQLSMQKENMGSFAALCEEWGNSGLFSGKK